MKKNFTFFAILLVTLWGCKKLDSSGTSDYTQVLQYSIDTTWQSWTKYGSGKQNEGVPAIK